MTKKYYAHFWLKDDPNSYVTMFKIKGSLVYDRAHRCFEDKDFYVRSAQNIVCYAVLDENIMNSRRFGGGFLIDHQRFKECRSLGYKRFEPKNKVIEWD